MPGQPAPDNIQGKDPSGSQPLREVVYLFDGDECIVTELAFPQFLSLTKHEQQHEALQARAAGLVRAAYCVVGNELLLEAAVFFQFLVDDEGAIDSSFNLPLDYLARQAGSFTLRDRQIRKASRGQCPVPWHSVNLWEPDSPQVVHELQSRLQSNELGLSRTIYSGDDEFFNDDEVSGEGIELTPLSDFRADRIAPVKSDVGQMTQRLSEVFGQSGKLSVQEMVKLHSDQLDQLREEFRRELELAQISYLDQIRFAQEEIHQLKSALRQEQGRSKRLQQMLRGDL